MRSNSWKHLKYTSIWEYQEYRGSKDSKCRMERLQKPKEMMTSAKKKKITIFVTYNYRSHLLQTDNAKKHRKKEKYKKKTTFLIKLFQKYVQCWWFKSKTAPKNIKIIKKNAKNWKISIFINNIFYIKIYCQTKRNEVT